MAIQVYQTEIGPYLNDASNLAGGEAERVFLPESEDEVREILAECSANRIPVTVSGAGTGLAGGRIPFGGVVLGALHDGFGGVAGSASSSRIFALAALPLRVPRPFRLARLRLPTTITHGVLAAPPLTRPG